MLRFHIITILAALAIIIPIENNAQNTNFTLKTVVIDPGHGGKDPGAIIGKLKEKDIALDVALKTGQLIKNNYPNVDIIYTRDDDRFIPLNSRANIANKANADLFISIHVNYFNQSGINGTETYILGNHRSEENLKVAQMENSVILLEEDHNTKYEGFDPNSAESYIMFELIQNEFMEQSRQIADEIQTNFTQIAKRRNRGVRQAGFLVLRNTAMPSILIELGFLSNPNDKAFLVTQKGKDQLAHSIYKAFAKYKTKIDSRSNQEIKQITMNDTSLPRSTTKKQTIENEIKVINKESYPGTYHAIQIVASRKKLPPKHKALINFKQIYVYEENGWYKYFTGLTSDFKEAKIKLKQTQTTTPDAFPASFKNGTKTKFTKKP